MESEEKKIDLSQNSSIFVKNNILQRNISISERFILNFLLIGLGSIIIVSSFSFFNIKSSLLNRAFDHLTDIRSMRKSTIENFFSERTRDSNLLSFMLDRNINTNELTTSSAITSEYLFSEKTLYLLSILQASGYYSGIKLITSEMSVYYEIADNELSEPILFDSEPGVFEKLQKSFDNNSAPRFTDYSFDSLNNSYFLNLITPIGDHEKAEGYLTLIIPVRVINDIVTKASEKGGFGESGETYIVGNDHMMRSNSRFQQDAVMNVEVNTIGAEKALSNSEGIEIFNDYRNIKVLSSFCPLNINGLDWVLLTEIDFNEVLQPIRRSRNQLLIIGVLIGVLVFLIAIIIASQITKPIKQLDQAVLKLSEGVFPSVNPGKSRNEISKLMETFNRMSETLKQRQLQLIEEKQKTLIAMIDGQDIERRRLSLDIHDGLIQSLVALRFKIESIQTPEEKKNLELLKNLSNQISEIIFEARHISNDLMPPVLEEFGLPTALHQLCERMSNFHNTKIRLEVNGELKSVDNRIAIYLYRIAQETISNAIKHSGSEEIAVQINEFSEYLIFMCEDNGCGFNINSAGSTKGNGIANIKERVSLLHGVVEFQSSPGSGTIVHIRIPKHEKINKNISH